LSSAIKILILIFFPYIIVLKICPKLGTQNNLPKTTVAVDKYYPKLGIQNNQPNTIVVVHEVKKQEHMPE
jgi:hypothetical protein